MSLTESAPRQVAEAASISSRELGRLPTEDRDEALLAIHSALQENKDQILAANAKDLEIATKIAADGQLSQSILKRLDLGRRGKYEDMLKGILDVKRLEDPGTFECLQKIVCARTDLTCQGLLRYAAPQFRAKIIDPALSDEWRGDESIVTSDQSKYGDGSSCGANYLCLGTDQLAEPR